MLRLCRLPMISKQATDRVDLAAVYFLTPLIAGNANAAARVKGTRKGCFVVSFSTVQRKWGNLLADEASEESL